MDDRIITRITPTYDVVTVTINNIPNNPVAVADIFNEIAKNEICVDMIAQSAPYKNLISISFSALVGDLSKIFQVIAYFKENFSSIITEINTGNGKISLFGEKMQNMYGVAAEAIGVLAKKDISIRLISTSDVDISFVVEDSQMENAINAFNSHYKL